MFLSHLKGISLLVTNMVIYGFKVLVTSLYDQIKTTHWNILLYFIWQCHDTTGLRNKQNILIRIIALIKSSVTINVLTLIYFLMLLISDQSRICLHPMVFISSWIFHENRLWLKFHWKKKHFFCLTLKKRKKLYDILREQRKE